MDGHEGDGHAARAPQNFVSRTSLAAAIKEVATRDPVVAHLIALVGPIKYRSPDPDGHFGALVRSIFSAAGGPGRASHPPAGSRYRSW
jgi:hypothetical protein